MAANKDAAVWRPFVWAAVTVSVTAGFGLGGFLFLSGNQGGRMGLWWPAAAQAHGHIQLFGWAGLMVLGIGFHFLPRLLGVQVPRPQRTRSVLILLVFGLVSRAIAQPALALMTPNQLHTMLQAVLVGSGILELTAATLALDLLIRMIRRRPTIPARTKSLTVAPFFFVSFAAFWLALGINLVGLLTAVISNHPLIDVRIDRLTVQLALHGFLVPVIIAMSARTFPLYFRTPSPQPRLLWLGLALALVGLVLRVFGELADRSPSIGLGQLVQATALAVFTYAIGIFAHRRPRPRRVARVLLDPIQLHAITAYLWLIATSVLLTLSSLTTFHAITQRVPVDAEWHTLGTGFVTLLILGVGSHLLPGFAQIPLRSASLVWVTVILGNAATVLRVGPLFLDADIPPQVISSLLGGAGVAGLAALVVFGANLTGSRQEKL